jgi:hypothetical protein
VEPALRGLELSVDKSYDRPEVTVSRSAHTTFFEGVRPSALVISAIGGCLFLCGFFIEGANGLGRALGLLGIAIVLFGIVTNLLLQASCTGLDGLHKRHLITQVVFTSCLALAVLALAGYLYHYGHLPGFMPARYDQKYHVKRLTDARIPSITSQSPAIDC